MLTYGVHVNPKMLPRLDELESDLEERRKRAGAIEGIGLTLQCLRNKRADALRLTRITRHVDLGIPAVGAGPVTDPGRLLITHRLALDSGGAGAAVSGCSVDPVDASAGVSSKDRLTTPPAERRRARGGRGRVPGAGLLRRDRPGLRQPGRDPGRQQDEAPLARPRLVVTGEVTGGRDVNDVVEPPG